MHSTSILIVMINTKRKYRGLSFVETFVKLHFETIVLPLALTRNDLKYVD